MYNIFIVRDVMNILVCDDEELIINVIKEYCLLEKYTVIEAENGLDAVKKWIVIVIVLMK